MATHTHITPTERESASEPDSAAALLAFEAPFLIEKLCSLRAIDAPEEARALFLELKRYLSLSLEFDARSLPMYSMRIDHVWHEFILFTSQYHGFCEQFAGRYLHHEPLASGTGDASGEPSFEEFARIYARRFGPLPALWHDEEFITPRSCLAHVKSAGPFVVRVETARATLLRGGESPVVLCRTNVRAESALRFIASEPLFLVRELPGLLDDGEKIALTKPLVQYRFLRALP